MKNMFKVTYLQAFDDIVNPSEVGRYVFVPGSKSRVRMLAESWQDGRMISESKEFLLYSGVIDEVRVSACSTGIGGVSVVTAVQQLIELGADTFIRVGVTGSLQSDVEVGDLTIASAAVRSDRVADDFLDRSIPAVATPEVTLALRLACQDHDYRFHTGVGATTGTFYCGEGRPGYAGYFQDWMASIVPNLRQAGVMDWDTETATLFSLCLASGVRCGRINGVVDKVGGSAADPAAEGRAVRASISAIQRLAAWDQSEEDIRLLGLEPS